MADPEMNLSEADYAQIVRNFTYHSPQAGQSEKYEALRAKARVLAVLIAASCPASRERSLAMTKLEESIFWANASIAREGK
jgi:hypothetical protein